MESSRCSALLMAAEFSLYRCLFKVKFKLEVPVMPSPVSSGSF